MTNQRAIIVLDTMIDCCMCADADQENIDAIHVAISAIKRQEPQERIMPNNDDILDGIEYRCPTCGRTYKKDSRYDYCISCGQHLLWDEDCISMMACDGGISK